MHVDFLDDYGTLGNLAKEVKNSHQKISTLYDELNTLKAKEKQLKEKRDLYEFQFNEINQINPRIDDEEELERGKNILENSEKLFGDTKYIYETLYEEKDSIFEKLAKIEDILHELSEIDKSFEEMKSECTTAKINVEDIAKFAEKYNSKIKFDPERLEAIRNRLGEFYKLKKKYGGTLKSVIEYKEEIEAELKLSESFDLEIEKLEKEIHSAKIIFSEQCVKISNERKTVAKKLEENIVKILSELGMEKSKFYVNFRMEKDKDGWAKIGNENYSATSKGVDIIEFYISPNPGEELKPLVKIASGGEISRIMLALKSLLAESDKIPTLIFDEIDIGVSGRIALALGKNLKKLSRSHQTLCITHLPQVAAMSDKHYSVSKVIEGKRTITQIRELSKNERITEIAKLLGGETVTETNIKNARELMEIAI
jgi:DNA repair protein RecN (Recombination protein N)